MYLEDYQYWLGRQMRFSYESRIREKDEGGSLNHKKMGE